MKLCVEWHGGAQAWHINVKSEVKDNWNMGMGNLGLKGWAFMLNGLAIYDLMGGAFII